MKTILDYRVDPVFVRSHVALNIWPLSAVSGEFTAREGKRDGSRADDLAPN